MNDESIISLYFARDEQAIAETAAAYGAFCHRLSVSILCDEGEAEECVNDTYLKVWNSIPPDRPRSLRAYLGRIVRNLSLNRYKAMLRRKRNRELETCMLELSECVTLPDDRLDDLPALLEGFLDTLRDDERRLFVGRYWHGYTAEALASAYGITPNAAVLRLRRTREKLRAYLTERGYKL